MVEFSGSFHEGVTMSEPVGVSGNQLRAIIERIEHVEEEIKELAEAKKEIYQEAKGNGFDVKIIREMIRLRKQDPKERDELETLLEEYWQAIKQAAPTGKAKTKDRGGLLGLDPDLSAEGTERGSLESPAQ